MGHYDDRDYDIGKGKPPRQYSWKPGQSGNPRGPKRRADSDIATMNEMLAEIVNERTEVTIGGRTAKLPKKYLILLALVHDALSGTPADRARAFKALYEADAFNLRPTDKQPTPDQEHAAIEELVMVLAKEAAAQDPVYAAELRRQGIDFGDGTPTQPAS